MGHTDDGAPAPDGVDALYLVGTFFSERYGEPIMLMMRPQTLEAWFASHEGVPDFSESTIEEMLTQVDFAVTIDHDQLHGLIKDLIHHHAEMQLYLARRAAQAKMN